MLRSIRNYIDKQITEIFKRSVIPDAPALPVGYNPLERIRGGLFHWVLVPFNKTEVWCQLRCLNQSQLEACGDMSCIMPQGEGKEKPGKERLLEIRNYQEALCRAVMNKPLFDDIFKLVGAEDFVLSEKREQLAEIRRAIDGNKGSLTEIELDNLNVKADTLELFLGYILPTDTMDFITWWAMGLDVSNIKKIPYNKFLEAAILAERNKGAPTDYISGVYTDHDKNDINKHAWSVYFDYIDQKKIETGTAGKSKFKFIGGPKSKAGLPKKPEGK